MAQGLSKKIKSLQFAFLSPDDPPHERREDHHRRHV